MHGCRASNCELKSQVCPTKTQTCTSTTCGDCRTCTTKQDAHTNGASVAAGIAWCHCNAPATTGSFGPKHPKRLEHVRFREKLGDKAHTYVEPNASITYTKCGLPGVALSPPPELFQQRAFPRQVTKICISTVLLRLLSRVSTRTVM